MDIGNNLNGKMSYPLIDFDFILNSDLGLIRFIRDNFQDERVFILDTLNKSDRVILSLLYTRSNPNPLSIISTESNMEDIDGLYKSFFDNYKYEIFRRSTSEKSIKEFVSMVMTSGLSLGVSPSIAVNDDMEIEEIRSHFSGKTNYIYKSDKVSIASKESFYVRDYRFFTDIGLTDLSAKKIYMQPKKINIDFFRDHDELPISTDNEFILMGKDYSLYQEENE